MQGCLSVQELKHTILVLLARPYAQLDCIFLLKAGGTQQTITSGGNQYANLICNLSIITQSQVHFY